MSAFLTSIGQAFASVSRVSVFVALVLFTKPNSPVYALIWRLLSNLALKLVGLSVF